MSLFHNVQLLAHWYDSAKSFDGEDKLFVKGFQVLVDLLAKRLTIRTGEVVKRIDWSGLYFAGEATEQKYFGTAHGAYLSGVRAAEEILD